MAGKGKREKIKLLSTAGTGYFYTTTKGKGVTEKLQVSKFDPKVRMMAKCQITGKKPLSGNRVSHANNRTKHRQLASVQSKRIWDDEKQCWVRMKVSPRALRMLNRMPLSQVRRKLSANA